MGQEGFLALQGKLHAQGKAELMHIYQVYMAVPAHGSSWEALMKSAKTTKQTVFYSIFRVHNPSDIPFEAQV